MTPEDILLLMSKLDKLIELLSNQDITSLLAILELIHKTLLSIYRFIVFYGLFKIGVLVVQFVGPFRRRD